MKQSYSAPSTISADESELEKPRPFPIVGIGVAEGAAEAFAQLVRRLPVDAGIGVVVVGRVEAAKETPLAEFIATHTKLPVDEVTDGISVERNRIYVTPPHLRVTIASGILRVTPRDEGPSQDRPIDLFFESLAEDWSTQAIGIVLSGEGRDGSAGVEAIKGHGGIAMAQDASAPHAAMPRNAIATGCVDYTLPPAGLAGELVRIARDPFGRAMTRVPLSGEADAALDPPADGEGGGLSPLDSILAALHAHSGVDFSAYKLGSVERRIMRRVMLGKFKTLRSYAAALRDIPGELAALYGDVLINVTNFFRNSEAFAALQAVVFPRLSENRRGEAVRFWIVGCSTGQEVYSLAIAYLEFCDGLGATAPPLQVFATDVSEAMLEKARAGLYANLEGEVSPERLARFFTPERGGHRVNKDIRERCVFARQNAIGDPPFSRMDLISCRNLMIYLEAPVQQQLLATFHYALLPSGYLFLGAAETIGAGTNLFELIDRKMKIYARQRVPTPRGAPGVSPRHPSARSAPAGRAERPVSDARAEFEAEREADRVTLHRHGPPGVLVDAHSRIVQFRGATGRYLEALSGRATHDILKMARAGLVAPLRSALEEARKAKSAARRNGVRFDAAGRNCRVNIEVIPLAQLRQPFWLILFEDPESPPNDAATDAPRRKLPPGAGISAAARARIKELERDLAEARDYAQSLQEQHEAATRELEVSHDEIQSANEEMQSINEELESSKEELVSSNEELLTVNEEILQRNVELQRLSSDLGNLYTSIDTPILVVDRELTLRHVTGPAGKIFHFAPPGVGQDFAGITHELETDDLPALLRTVIESGAPHERSVRARAGNWFLLRVRPYVARQGAIDGAVVVLFDIDRLKRAESEAANARRYAEAIVRTARDPLVVLRADLSVNSASDAFYRFTGETPASVEGRAFHEICGGLWNVAFLRALLEDILPHRSAFNDAELEITLPTLGRRIVLLSARPLEGVPADAELILLSIEDTTERFRSRTEVRTSELRYRRLFETALHGVLIFDPETWRIADANPAALVLLGCTAEELSGRLLADSGLWLEPDVMKTCVAELVARQFAARSQVAVRRKDGSRCIANVVANLYMEDGRSVGQCRLHDVTEQVETMEALRSADERLRAIFLQATAGIVEADLTGQLLQANPCFAEIVGRSPHEIAGLRLQDITHHEDRAASQTVLAKLIAEGGQTVIEQRYFRPDGKVAWVRASITRVNDKDGRGLSLLAVVHDIGERKRLENALRASEEYFRELAQTLPLGVWTYAPDARIDFVNQHWLEYSGQTLDRFKAQPENSLEMLHPDDRSRVIAAHRAGLAAGNEVTLEARFRRAADGAYRWFLHRAVPINDAHGARLKFIGTCTDIDDLKRAQAILAQHATELEDAVAARTAELRETIGELEVISYSVTHDMRAPLRAMRGFADLLLAEFGPDASPEAQSHLRRISSAAQRMDALIEDVLTYTRVMRSEITLSPVDLDKLVRDILETYPDFSAQRAHVTIEGTLPLVWGHAASLTLSVSNLLGNALKFVAPGAAPAVTVRADRNEGVVRLWVEDQGIGIAANHHEHIFGIFERVAASERYPGTGIGLAVVRKAVERMHAKVGVDSALGSGSRFWLELRSV